MMCRSTFDLPKKVVSREGPPNLRPFTGAHKQGVVCAHYCSSKWGLCTRSDQIFGGQTMKFGENGTQLKCNNTVLKT